ncbi:MAG TPA: YetF domain-containing protein [bacterium]|jgi:uncharacterized membrane protein YcaP (DUF421 family)
MAALFRGMSSLLEVALRSGVIYVAILLGMRFAGKRELGQMNVIDLVVILLIANAVQNAMVGSDNTIAGGIVAAFVILALNKAASAVAARSERWRVFLEGKPTQLIADGKLLMENLRKEGVTSDEVEMAMRERGFASMKEVKQAFLETDGTISFIDHASRIARTRKHIRQFRH